MQSANIEKKISNLSFSLQQMLGADSVDHVSHLSISQSTTSCIVRVSIDQDRHQKLFIKTTSNLSDQDAYGDLGIREVEFYKFINSITDAKHLNAPRCIRHHIAPDNKEYYLVLEDVSDLYVDYQEVDFSDIESWKCAAVAVAHFHGLYQNKLSEQQIIALQPPRNEVDHQIDKLKNALKRFGEYCGNRVEKSVLILLENSIPTLKGYQIETYQRLLKRRNITITHGDIHTQNLMYPKKNGQLPLLIDWQFWGIGVGAYDLRHLIGSGLSAGMRHLQEELVHHYYACLTTEARSTYSWEECWQDYRKGIVDNLYMPVWQYAGFGWEYSRWCHTLENAVENYHFLHCDDM